MRARASVLHSAAVVIASMVLAAVVAACRPAAAPSDTGSAPTPAVRLLPALRADFGGAATSADMRALVNWVLATRDHGDRSFAAIDKRLAKVYVFAADGRLIGSSPVLIGFAPGDDSEPGIGNKAIADIRPDERTTPAGRFVTVPGINAHGKPVIWIDYAAGVSMHSVITDVPSERRLQRLASSDPAEHRISWGCVNLPADFFDNVAAPAFSERGGIIYVLPDTRPLQRVFPGLVKPLSA